MNEPKDDRFRKALSSDERELFSESIKDKVLIRRDDKLPEAPMPEYVLMIFEISGKVRWTYVNVPIIPIEALEPGEMGMIVLPIVSRGRHGREVVVQKQGDDG